MVQMEVFFQMELKLSKSMTCRIAVKGRWGNAAAAWMGLSFFLRMVYYFGLQNMNDVPPFEIGFSVVLPLLISVAFILCLKLEKLNQPMVIAGLCVAFAVSGFLSEPLSLGVGISAVLVLAMSGLILAAVLGYIPERKWLLWAGMAALGFRVLFVDLFGYILPLGDWQIVAWIPKASNLCGVAAVSTLCAALRLKKAE